MYTNTRENYGLVARWLHWLTAALIFTLVPLGWYMHELPDATSADVSYKSWFYSLHKTLGVLVLGIAIIRVFWMASQPRPDPLHPERTIEAFAAKTVHWLLYGSILVLPLSGWLQHAASDGFSPILWPFGQDLPFVSKSPELVRFFGTVHYLAGLIIICTLALHVAGTLKHVIIDRDNTLNRMIFGAVEPPKPNAYSPHASSNAPFWLAILILCGFLSFAFFSSPSTREHSPNLEDRIQVSENSSSNWFVDYGASSLGVKVLQSGKEVSGTFSTWAAEVRFDPEATEAAMVSVEIDVRSLTIGNVTEQALSPGILNALLHPKAVFVSDNFTRLAGNNFDVPGNLSLSGTTRPVILKIELDIENNIANVSGSAVISRLEFGIGATAFPDEKTIGDEVLVSFRIQAERQN